VKIVYQELVSPDDFSQCIELQRSLFNLSDLDVVSPLILQLIARENPPMGIMFGAFNVSDSKKELIGFIISMATLQEKSAYIAMMGVEPRYRNQNHGLNLFLKLREAAIKRNIDYMFGVFEPLEKSLAHLFFNHLCFQGIHYHESVFYQNNIREKDEVPTDKILFKWDLKAFSTYDREKNSSKESSCLYPIATTEDKPNSPYVLVEIPKDFNRLKKEDVISAAHWRRCTKEILTHYINHHNYIVHDCVTFEENLNKKSFYLLKAQ
jgi:predicted GNAT superfamily acetyltransferase